MNARSCPTLCDPMDYTVHGILQARTLEWVPFLSPADLRNPRIELRSPTLQAVPLPSKPPGKPPWSDSYCQQFSHWAKQSTYIQNLSPCWTLASPGSSPSHAYAWPESPTQHSSVLNENPVSISGGCILL